MPAVCSPRRSRPHRSAANAGFTLIEVLVALIVSMVLVGGLVKTMHQGWSESLRLKSEAKAILVARTVLALLDDRGWSEAGIKDGDAGSYRWRAEVQEITLPGPPGSDNPLDKALKQEKKREKDQQAAQTASTAPADNRTGAGATTGANADTTPPTLYAIRIIVTDPTGKSARLEAIRVQSAAH